MSVLHVKITQCLYNTLKLCIVLSLTSGTVTVAFMVINHSCSTILTFWCGNAHCKYNRISQLVS